MQPEQVTDQQTPTPQSTQINPPPTTFTPPQQDPQTIPPQVKPKKSRIKMVLLATGLVVLLILAFIIFTYASMQKQRSAGKAAIAEYMSILKSDDKDKLYDALRDVMGDKATSSDPNDLQEITDLATQTSIVASAIHNADPELVESSFGSNATKEKLVTNIYEIKQGDTTAFYKVQATQKQGAWHITSVELSKER